MTKHIFVTGGVVSSLGKGLTAASVALLLNRRGYRTRLQKLDPYLNVDPGTMSPYQHGEVYVTVDGAETDLDLGHYERFTGTDCNQDSNYTTGRIYSNVMTRERDGGYLGQTVQVIPHITDEIKKAILSLDSPDVDIVITEIGGTVGDIESLPFLEAIRQLKQDLGKENGLFMHVTLVPFLKAAGEMKTKPSQQSVGILRTIGIIPDILICRCEHSLADEHKEKLSLFCNVDRNLVIEEKDVDNSIYEVPLALAEQDLDIYILEKMNMHVDKLDLSDWQKMINTLIAPKNGEVEIAVVGKYITLQDSYKSIYEALTHGGIANNTGIITRRVESEDIERKSAKELLTGVSGILVPGGFGGRGIEGKIEAVKYARENNIPFFGICLGMQCATMEFARNVCGMKKANSTEFNKKTPYPVIDLMREQKAIRKKGGTMRLGSYPCILKENSIAKSCYGITEISERHRHRWEFNNKYRRESCDKGLVLSGLSPDNELVEIIEYPKHPWFLACQFHPEFQSTPLQAHPLFKNFITAAINLRDRKKSNDA
ncbi:CTP synthase [PVC group bacterium]|nr:CTP synthase [PVC group bacterium]